MMSDTPKRIGWFSLTPETFGLELAGAVYSIQLLEHPSATDPAEIEVKDGVVINADLNLQAAVGRTLADCLTIWRQTFPNLHVRKTLLRDPAGQLITADVEYWIIAGIPIEVAVYTPDDTIRDVLHQHMAPHEDYTLYIIAVPNVDPDEYAALEGQCWTRVVAPGNPMSAADLRAEMYAHLVTDLARVNDDNT
jgi:hypothetical protein